ncbi:MAG: twin-arginine translocation signal domain-containing protein, partial [Verrucomicrobiae bacterium]|nr:twin-arginine translocation signal domain-containing protein [Verrucomicrobiae bacterium]
MKTRPTTRRDFVKLSASAIAGLSPLAAALPAPVFAAGSDRIRVGIIGCGNRGSGAAANVLEADPAVEIVAVADALGDRIEAFKAKVAAECQRLPGSPTDRVKI